VIDAHAVSVPSANQRSTSGASANTVSSSTRRAISVLMSKKRR
jgi:hypothetical protein